MQNFQQACRQRFACRTCCDLATEFSRIAQNENSKKERTTNRKPAMSFASCYVWFFPFCFVSKQVELIQYATNTFQSFVYYENIA